METIVKSIRDGKYKTKQQYPCIKLYPDKEVRREKLREYRADVIRLENEVFKQDLLEEYGMLTHPKREKLWNMSWERGHSACLHEVAREFDSLVDLVTTEVTVLLEHNEGEKSDVVGVYATTSAALEEETVRQDENKSRMFSEQRYERLTIKLK